MRKRLLPISLVIAMVISLLQSYLLIFDAGRLSDIFSKKEVVITTSPEEVSSVSYFQPAKLAAKDIFQSKQILMQEEGDVFLLMNHSDKKKIEDLLQEAPLRVKSTSGYRDANGIEKLLSKDYLQLTFNTALPIGVVNHLVRLSNETSTSFTFDRILIPAFEDGDDKGVAYLINSQTETYLEAEIDREAPIRKWQEEVSLASSNWAKADYYEIDSSYMYLPIEAFKIKSSVYTLDRITESLLIRQTFPTADYVTSSASASQTRSYQNLESTLTFYYNRHMMILSSNKIKDRSGDSFEENIKASYNAVRNYDYWNGGLQYIGVEGNQHIFRRYIDGFPVFVTSSDLPDYAVTKVQIQNTQDTDIVRYQMPLLILQAKIPDQGGSVEIVSAHDLIDTINQRGYMLEDFTDITVGYQWGEDMEEARKLVLTPMWFLEYKGKYYSLEDIEKGLLDSSEDTRTQEQEDSDGF